MKIDIFAGKIETLRLKLRDFISILGLGKKKMWQVVVVNNGLVSSVEFTTREKAEAFASQLAKLAKYKLEIITVVEK